MNEKKASGVNSSAPTSKEEIYTVNESSKSLEPSIISNEYANYANNEYQNAINEAIRQLTSHQISNDEFSERVLRTALEYNRRMYAHADAIATLEQEEEALAEFDTDLKEQLRMRRLINSRIKERTRQLREERRQAKLREQLERETARTDALNSQLRELEDNSSKTLH